MLLYTKAEVTRSREAVIGEFEFFDVESLLEDLLCLVSGYGDVAGDFFVTTDAECTDGETGGGEDGLLVSQLLQHTGTAVEWDGTGMGWEGRRM